MIDGFTSATNDRFENHTSFVANSYDLSGVGRSSDGRWGTLISPNVFLSANHYHPSNSSTMTFFETNDPNGPSLTIGVQSGQRMGMSDIWVGVLDSPVTSGYNHYDFATEDITNLAEFSASPYALENAYLFGRSPSSFGSLTDVAVGRNILDSWDDFSSADAIIAIDNQPTDGNYVTYEAFLQTGDSGAPLMVDDGNGNLKVLGANWFIDSATFGIGLRDYSGMSYTGNWDDDIQTVIDTNPVPEPGSLLLFALGSLFCLRRVRRQG